MGYVRWWCGFYIQIKNRKGGGKGVSVGGLEQIIQTLKC